MKIGIIGAGNIGSALTRRFTAAGHQVFVANSRGPQTLTKLAAETGAKPVNVKEAAHAGDVVVVTIPEKNISSLTRETIIRGSATAASTPSKTACRKVSGSRSNWDVP